MKKFKIMAFVCTAALLAISPLALTACNEPNNFNIDAKQVYAMSAATSVNYLLAQESATYSARRMAANDTATEQSRPTQISNQDVDGMKSCLTMFDSVIQGGRVDQTTTKNPEETGELANYNFVMNISVPGFVNTIKLYYNETETETNTEIEDEKEEVEVSTKLQGVMVVGDVQFDVVGKREFEKEGDETESSIEFTTKSKTNQNNYVTVKQTVEIENGEYELEYEYEIYQEGNLVQDIETEIEIENDKIELEYQLKDGQTLKETVYKITKGQDEDSFVVSYTIDENTQNIDVVKISTGYTFTYANGYVENLAI